MGFFYFSTLILFLIACAMLCLLVLVQESKSGGLGASFGGDTSDSLFGTSTPEVLKKMTGWLAIVFISMSFILSFWTAHATHTASPIQIEKNVQDN